MNKTKLEEAIRDNSRMISILEKALIEASITMKVIDQENDMLKEYIQKYIEKSTLARDGVVQSIVWLMTFLVLIAFALILPLAPPSILSSAAEITSWVATAFILFCGLLSAYFFYKINKQVGLVISIAYASIFTAYIGYITIDYGSIRPNISAFIFNIATIFQSVAIFFTVYLSYKLLKGNKIHNGT